MKFPHPLALLTACIALAAVLTWVLPAGQFERRHDEATGRELVVAGTYHRVEPAPVTPLHALLALPRGMTDAASVIFLVLLVGGAFVVVDKTGALRLATDQLVRSLAGRATLVIPIVCLFFATGGALENMAEEIIALIPILLLLTARLGFDPLVACATSVGAAAVGSAFSPINPFAVLIAQRVAGITPASGWAFRLVVFAVALAVWIFGTMRYAARTRRSAPAVTEAAAQSSLGTRGTLVLLIVAATFATFVYGLLRLGWDFDHLSAVFFAMGVLAGLVGGLGIAGTFAGFAEGFAAMAYAASVIGFARAIFVVLDQGRVIDTIVNGIFQPLGHVPVALSGLGMVVAHAAMHFPVPSNSGQAVLTMPVLVPLADLLGMSRQAVVLAYQYGGALADMVTPTNGALMAVIAAAGVSYEAWIKFAVRWWLALTVIGGAAVLVAIAIGLR